MQIELKIYGTVGRQAGFAPLFSCGAIPPDLTKNLDNGLPESQGNRFLVKTTESLTLYVLSDSAVRSNNAAAEGSLMIVAGIRRGYRLAGNASPYDLLNDIHAAFVQDYMVSDGVGLKAFKETRPSENAFDSIIAKYSLEPTNVPYVIMNPFGALGIINLSPDKLRELMIDPFYSEFSQYKEIVLGEGFANPTESLKSLEIPRPMLYTVYINDVYASQKVTPNSTLSYNARGNEDETFPSGKLKVQDIIDSRGKLENSDGTFEIDPRTYQLKVTLNAKPVMWKVKFDFPKSQPGKAQKLRALVEKGGINIMLGSKNLNADILNDTCTIPAKEKSALTYVVHENPDGYNLSITQKVYANSKTIAFEPTMEKIEVAKPKPANEIGYVKDTPTSSLSRKKAQVQQPQIENVSNQQQSYELPKRPKNLNEFLIGAIFGLIVGLILGIGGYYCVNKFIFPEETTVTDDKSNGEENVYENQVGGIDIKFYKKRYQLIDSTYKSLDDSINTLYLSTTNGAQNYLTGLNNQLSNLKNQVGSLKSTLGNISDVKDTAGKEELIRNFETTYDVASRISEELRSGIQNFKMSVKQLVAGTQTETKGEENKSKVPTEEQLVDAFNKGNLTLCSTYCSLNKDFEKYLEKIKYILGFWKYKDNSECERLKEDGWYNNDKKPTKDHFGISRIEEIPDVAQRIKEIVERDF